MLKGRGRRLLIVGVLVALASSACGPVKNERPSVEKPKSKPAASRLKPKPKTAPLEAAGRMRPPGLPLYKYDDRFLEPVGVFVEVGVERIAEGVTWTEYYAVEVPLELAESIAEKKSPESSEQTLTAELLEGSLIAFTVDAKGETTDIRPATGRPRPIAGEAGWLDLGVDGRGVIKGSLVRWRTNADGTGVLRLLTSEVSDTGRTLTTEVNIFLDPSTRAVLYGNPETTVSKLASYDKDWEGPHRGGLTIEVGQKAGGLRAVRVTAPKY